MKTATNIVVTRDDASWEVEIKAQIPAESLVGYRAQAIKEIQKTAKIDGFRVGKAPEDAIIRIYGEAAVMRQAAEEAIQAELPLIVASENVAIVEAPKVTTDVPEMGKPLSFTARAALAPVITLPDYKKIAKKHTEKQEDTAVTDAEHSEALAHIRRERARIDKIEAGTEPQKAADETKAMEIKDLPELDDAFVQSLGYADTETFGNALRENIEQEKKIRATEKVRAAILDELVKDSKISYPASLREYELDEMESRLTDDLARMGQTFDAYLKDVKKTREEMRTEWKDAADKRAKVRLILAEIARQENLNPSPEALEHEMVHAREHYPKADEQALRSHITHAMRNEATLRFLEGNPEPVGHTEHNHS